MALLSQRHRDWGCFLVLPPQNSSVYLGVGAGGLGREAPKTRTSADSSQEGNASLESCCSASSAHALLAQRHRYGAACLSCPLKLQTYHWVYVQRASSSPALKMRTSPDSSQAERDSLEGCCSSSSAQGSACTEAQRLGLLACIATSNFIRRFGGLCRGPLAALL